MREKKAREFKITAYGEILLKFQGGDVQICLRTTHSAPTVLYYVAVLYIGG